MNFTYTYMKGDCGYTSPWLSLSVGNLEDSQSTAIPCGMLILYREREKHLITTAIRQKN